jgi:hypothetical protein
MARTKNSPFPQSHSYIPHKDPWEIEHDALLQHAPNAICHSDTIYTGVVHKGFNADSTAEELIRRYPPFQETEQHREFLVRSIGERYIIPGEKDDYFTPLQLWEEDDRVNGKKVFTRGDESSSCADESEDEAPDLVIGQEVEPEPVVLKHVPRGRIGEEQLESDEQLALLLGDPVDDELTVEKSEGPSTEQKGQDVEMTDDDLAELFGETPEPEEEQEPPAITVTTPEAEDADEIGKDPELPITIQSDDHATTITHHYPDVQRLLDSLDLSSEASLTAVTSTSVHGCLVLAVLGHVKANNSAGSAVEHPIRVDDSAAGASKTNKQRLATENLASDGEWNIIAQRPHHSTLAFLSGLKTYSALLAEIRWDIDTIVATTVSYNDGRVHALLVGEQQMSGLSRYAASAEEIDPADRFDAFFTSIRTHKSVPAEHADIASLLEVAHSDMIEAGALAAPSPEEGAADSSDSESETTTPLRPGRSTSEQIDALKRNTVRIEKQLNRAMKRANASTTRSTDYSKERMLQLLQPPAAEHINHSKENRVPTGVQSSLNDLPPQEASGFPASFNKIPNNTNANIAAPNPKPAPSKKRARTPSNSDDEDGEDGEDDSYTIQPQRKRRTAAVPGRGRGRPRKHPVVHALGTPGKSQANKALTAAESLQSIADVRAKIAEYDADKLRRSASPAEAG